MPKYRVVAHRRVHNFVIDLRDEKLKNMIKDTITRLENYLMTLREMDAEKRGVRKGV